MDAQAFWRVIGEYNQHTAAVQGVLLLFLAASLALSYCGKVRWLAKFALGILHLYLGVVFFGIYGTEPIQKFFALPLYVCCGCLFLYESARRRDDPLQKPTPWQTVLLLLYLCYPLASLALGNTFPQMVTHVMPCPAVSAGIAVYAGYQKKNPLLLALLTVWGLTGIKSLLFSAYEDLILLVCGIYGVWLLAKYWRRAKKRAAPPLK